MSAGDELVSVCIGLEVIDPVEQRRPVVAGAGAAAGNGLAIKELLRSAIGIAVDSAETNTGEGLRSAVEGFEGGKSWSKLLCNQSEIRQ